MPTSSVNKMWGGRFETAPSSLLDAINVSIDVDKRLYKQDIAASMVHVRMLARQGIVDAADAQAIEGGLQAVLAEIEGGTFPFRAAYEDIHMNVEARLRELIGPVAGRLHTARSRNDQVTTDFRLWVRDAIDALASDIAALSGTLSKRAQEHAKTVMPGFTHLQVAQPVTFGMHMDAYVQMLARDVGRFADARTRMNECPLGACALAGTGFPIDRAYTAHELGFRGPMVNTMDAVGARDYVLEFLSAAAICAGTLSRLAEELVLWSTPQFGYIRMSDDYSTGSSIMPQKRNPDAAELLRAKSGAVTGTLMQMLMVMKALPMTYNKDMQEDKQAVFTAFDTLSLCLRVADGMIAGMQVNAARMRADAVSGYATATRLADWLVAHLNMPFRDAHHVTGQIVRMAEKKGLGLHDLTLAELQSVEPRITAQGQSVLVV